MPTQTSAPPVESIFHWTVEKYHQLIDTGILGETDKIELIRGNIVQMSPINPPHAAAVDTLARAFYKKLPDDVLVRVQNPVTLSEDSEPEPDIALVRMAEHRYRKRHPSVDDILLVIEVANSSGEKDRHSKIPMYAQARIEEVWLVDLRQKQLWAYLDPQNDHYKTIRIFDKEIISPLFVSNVTIDVAGLF